MLPGAAIRSFADMRRRLLGEGPGERVRDRLVFISVFVGAKVVALVGMLWLARVSDPRVFGGIELALAVGLIVAGIGLLGVPGGVTRQALTMGEPKIGDHLSFAAATIALPTTVAALASLALGGPPALTLTFASCSIAAFQAFGTTFARIRARPLINSVVDPLPVLAAILIATVLWAVGRLTLPMMALATTILAAGLSTVLLAGFVRSRRADFGQAYRRVLGISLPILAYSGVAMMVGAGLRPLLGLRFSLEELALYSLGFRLCAPSMLMHQMLVTAFFARVYTATDATFQRVASGLVAVCVLMVAAVWLGLPVLVRLVFPAYMPMLPALEALFPLIGLQVIYWIIIALLEMKVGRHAVAGAAAVGGYLVFAAFVLVFLGLKGGTLLSATIAFDIALAVFAGVQLVLLERKGVRLRLLGWVLPGAGAACAAMTVLAG